MFLEKNYKLITLISVLFVTVLMISNIVSTKIVQIWPLVFDWWTILFPLSYIFWDILTEVYGFKRARRIIWMWFFSLFLMSLTIYIVWLMPSSSDWAFQEDYQNILWYAPRIIMWSLIAYLVWEFVNSYVLAKMKVIMKWKVLALRTITSTIFWQWFDTIIFVFIAFYWLFPNETIIQIIIANYIIKVWIEIIFTPLTIFIVNKIKKIEKEDFYDSKTNFNPLSLK